MNKQYRFLGHLLELLRKAQFEDLVSLKLGALIYRLKYLLLKMESCNDVDMQLLCPMDELEVLRTLLAEAADAEETTLVQHEVEEWLRRIETRLEKADGFCAAPKVRNPFVDMV